MIRRFIAAHGRLALATLLCLFMCSCEPPGVVRAAKPEFEVEPRSEPYPRANMVSPSITAEGCELVLDPTAEGIERIGTSRDWELRGAESFDPESLPTEVRCWYEQLWSVLESEPRYRHYTELARSDDLYLYSRSLNTHVNALLTALRITGDLALLDEVDRLAQHMRSALDDSWRGPAAFDSDGIDGYLNWVWRQAHSSVHPGRDMHVTDEMRTHALVAQFAWAFRVNEDLTSPNGVDYRERADFWTDYLVEHFEAKWRDRLDVPWPDFPFLTRPHTHETFEFVRYNHYLYLLTGKPQYQDEAVRLSQLLFDNFEVAQSEAGEALVVPRSLLSKGGKEDYLLPSTYVRYVYSSAVDMFFEGVEPWSEAQSIEMLAHSLSEFIMDNGSNDFARDMGGGMDRAGVTASEADDWPRFGPIKFNNSPYVLLAAWDGTRKIAEISKEIYAGTEAVRRDIFIPVGLLVDRAMN